MRSPRPSPVSAPVPDALPSTRSSDGIVLLDIERDAYFCLYDPLDRREEATAAGQEIAAVQVPTFPMGPNVADTMWQDAPAVLNSTPTLGDTCRFACALIVAGLRFRFKSFADLIAHAATTRAPVSPDHPPAPHTLIARFDRLCLWLPFRMQCLFRCFFLLHFLRRYGIAADWVFGAALFPFRAHCWLADGRLLLGDQAHRTGPYAVLHVVKRPGRC